MDHWKSILHSFKAAIYSFNDMCLRFLVRFLAYYLFGSFRYLGLIINVHIERMKKSWRNISVIYVVVLKMIDNDDKILYIS